MLRMLRQGGVSQWLMGGVVVAIIIVFMVPAMSAGGGSLEVQCAAKVRSECVTVKDYYAAYGLISASQELTNKRAKGLGLPAAALDGLVERELLVAEADRLGIAVSEEALDKELVGGRVYVSVPVAQHAYLARYIGIGEDLARYLPVTNSKTGEFDYKIYERVIRNVAGRSANEFRDMQRREVTANRVRALVKSHVRVSPEEVWYQYKREKARATARTVSVQKVWIARYVTDTSDKALDAWLKDNQAKVDEKWPQAKAEWVDGCPVVREFVAAFPQDVSDEDKVLARADMDQALPKLKVDFAATARSLSDGPSAPVGGMLGCLSEKYGPGSKELLVAVDAMKPGDVSGVIETPKGLVVLKLERKLAAGDAEKVGKRELARALMSVDQTEKLTKEFADSLLAAVKGGEGIGEAADRLAKEFASRGKKLKADEEPEGMEDSARPKLHVTAAFAQGSRPLPNAMEDVTAIAFGLPKADAVHPNLIALQGGFAVLQLKEKTEAKREELEKERFDYSERMRQAKEQEALRIYVEGLKKAAEGLITKNEELISDKSTSKGDES